MDRFRYQVVRANGKSTWGWESADDSDELMKQLWKKYEDAKTIYVEYEAPDEDEIIQC